MIYDTFMSLKVGDRLIPMGKKRSYPVIGIKTINKVRVVVVRVKRESEFEISYVRQPLDKHYYLNWDLVRESSPEK